MKKIIWMALLVFISLNVSIAKSDEIKKEEIKNCVYAIEKIHKDFGAEMAAFADSDGFGQGANAISDMTKKQIELEKIFVENIEGYDVSNECLPLKELYLQVAKYMLAEHEILVKKIMNNDFVGASPQINKANDIGAKIMGQIQLERSRLFQQFQIQE